MESAGFSAADVHSGTFTVFLASNLLQDTKNMYFLEQNVLSSRELLMTAAGKQVSGLITAL